MSIKQKLLIIAGKGDFKLDDRIGIAYIFRQCWKYGWMMIRGAFFSTGAKNIKGKIFVGKHVHCIEKRYLKVGTNCKLLDGVYIDALSTEGVNLGNSVILGRDTRIECTGSLSHVGKGVTIGDGTTFGAGCYFGAAGGIEIGDNVVAGQLVRFHSENHNYDDLTKLIKEQGVSHKGIKIGNNCWIGAGVVFLDGATLEDGCVVAANAVVNKAFPQNSIIGGVPAKIIKHR